MSASYITIYITNIGQWNASCGLSCSDTPDHTVGTKKFYYSQSVIKLNRKRHEFSGDNHNQSVLQSSTVNYATAESNCASYGMTLPTFENQAEYDALMGLPSK